MSLQTYFDEREMKRAMDRLRAISSESNHDPSVGSIRYVCELSGSEFEITLYPGVRHRHNAIFVGECDDLVGVIDSFKREFVKEERSA